MKAVHFEGAAYEQFVDWVKEDFTIFEKIIVLIKDISRDPFKGLGKPEPLRHKYTGYWSRRITHEHRLIYKMADGVIVIASLYGHYDN